MARITKRSAVSYTVVYDAPPGPDGKRRQVSKAIKGPKKNAQAELNRILHEIQTGTHVVAQNMTVAEFAERWLKDYCRTNLNANSLEDYRNALARYVYPHLGSRKVERVTAFDIQGLYTTLQESGGMGGRPLSAGTVRIVHRMLNRMFGHAVQWQVIARNPVANATPPRTPSNVPSILETTEAVDAILEAARGTWLYLPTLVSVGMALRRGEALALRWSDVDLTERTLTVGRQLRQTRAAGLEFDKPKTEAGWRVLPIPGFVAEELRRHRSRYAEWLLSEGRAWDDGALLIARPDGGPFTPDGLSRGFARIAEQAGYPEVTFHGCRHTCITFLIEKGVPMNVVSKIAGHASPEVTMRLYAHVLQRMKWAAAEVMDGLFEGSKAARFESNVSIRCAVADNGGADGLDLGTDFEADERNRTPNQLFTN